MSNIEKNSLIKFFINGKESYAPRGSNLLQAILDSDVHVSNFCYHPELSVESRCRMCLVTRENDQEVLTSCSSQVVENEKYISNSEKIKNLVKQNLELMLINHPLDCTVCDKSGECLLQDEYMRNETKDSSMIDQKNQKNKFEDIGKEITLNSERCILCSKCVRFTSEVTKSNELAILNKSDKSEVFAVESIKNNYSQNLVDLCPVGALANKDFRSSQRVWLLKETDSSCIGCERGCLIKLSYNNTGVHRITPKYSNEINKHWMCDDGRSLYKQISSPTRLQDVLKKDLNSKTFLPSNESELFNQSKEKKIKMILSTCLTNEEYTEIFKKYLKQDSFDFCFYFLPEYGQDDDLLLRANKNTNLYGIKTILKSFNLLEKLDESYTLDFLSKINENDSVFVVIPEIIQDRKHLEKNVFDKVKNAGLKVSLSINYDESDINYFDYLIPTLSYFEKCGTMNNFEGEMRQLQSGRCYSSNARSVSDYLDSFYKERVQ